VSFEQRELSVAEESLTLELRIEQLERTLANARRELALTDRLASLLESALLPPDPGGLPGRIVEIGQKLLDINFISLVAPAESGEEVEPLAAVGCGNHPFPARRWQVSKDSSLVAAIQRREPVTGARVFNHALDRELGLRSALHVPVLRELDVVAVLTFGERAPGRLFDPIEVRAARGLALWAGLLLDRAQDRQRAEALELLLQSQYVKLQQTEKLKALGQLVSGVAHELNNPLTAILGRVSLIQRADSLDAARRQAERIKEAAARAAKIAKGLSTFARSHPAERGPLNLNDLVRWATDFQEYQLAVDNIRVETELDPNLPAIIGDHHELEQVLINLMLNAQHAMVAAHGSGCLRLSTRRSGAWVELRVQDDGPGIPAELLPKIFEPFFTTKPVGEGTGLGLSIVQEIVAGHGGKVSVESSEGNGATIVVALPPMRSAVPERT
jgi:signal transduction histidine kinase